MDGSLDERLLEESAEDLYDNAPCGYISTLPDGTIVKVNQTFLTWTGHQREDLLAGKRFRDLLTVACRIFHETHYAPLLRMQGFVHEMAIDVLCSDGRVLPAMINSVQRRDSAGKPLFNRTTIVNATDRRVYERELVLARRKAEQAAKAKADLLSMLSHEIRTPLNAVIGVTHLLDRTGASPQQAKYIRILKSSSESLLHLINDILDFSKIEAGKVALEESSFNLREALRGILSGFNGKAEEKRLALRLEIDERLPGYVVGDKVKIGQVITNLVSNAVKFTARGSVTVALQLAELSPEVVSLDVRVSDTGIGIAADRLAIIFEEFTQGSSDIRTRFGGTGLGLAISQKLLGLYGSKMAVQSVPGEGTTFSFNLRLRVGQPAGSAGAAAEAAPHEESLRGVKVLVVEDNKVNVFLLARFLQRWGVDFDVVENGRKAVEKVVERRYDVVLMDLQMPEMDGYEATRAIRALPEERHQRLPVIALSASARIGQQDRMASSGITDFVGKPFDPKVLFRKLALYAARPEGGPAAEGEERRRTVWESALLAPDFSLEGFRNQCSGDPRALAALSKSAIKDCEASKHAFQRAIEAGSLAELELQVQKIKVTLELLEANALWAALRRAAGLLAQPERDPARVQAAIHAIQWELELIVAALQQETRSGA